MAVPNPRKSGSRQESSHDRLMHRDREMYLILRTLIRIEVRSGHEHGRATTTYSLPIEGRDEWLAPAIWHFAWGAGYLSLRPGPAPGRRG